jgi:hypothetical protein
MLGRFFVITLYVDATVKVINRVFMNNNRTLYTYVIPD